MDPTKQLKGQFKRYYNGSQSLLDLARKSNHSSKLKKRTESEQFKRGLTDG